MLTPMELTARNGVAVALAVTAAILFGLAATRQHQVVQGTVTTDCTRSGRSLGQRLGQNVGQFATLLRTRAWLVGALQGLVGGSLHGVALSLAPLALVQPIGVLAVPVTVVAGALRQRRRPPLPQITGAAVSIASIVVLTMLLLTPGVGNLVVPSAGGLVMTVTVTLLATLAVGLLGSGSGPLVRCTSLAVAAAVLFGLTSTMVRLIGQLASAGFPVADRAVLVTSGACLLAIVPVGVWALQTAYASGSAPVVICCLTLIDPLTAVAGGAVLLHERVVLDPVALVVVACCALLTATGVVLLSASHPADPRGARRAATRAASSRRVDRSTHRSTAATRPQRGICP